MMQRRRVDELWRSRDFRALIFLGVLGLLILILAFAIRGILGPFILAGILAMMLNPAVNAAERRHVPRLAALLALYGVIAAVLAAAVFFLAPIVSQEFTSLAAQGPAIASYFQDLADKDHVVSVLGIPIDLRQAYNDAVRNLPALLAGHLSSVVENVFMLINWIFQTILVLLVAFFLVKDAHPIRRFFRDLVPQGYRTDAHETDGGPRREVIVFRLRPKHIEPLEPSSKLAEILAGPTKSNVPIEQQQTEKAYVAPSNEPYDASR